MYLCSTELDSSQAVLSRPPKSVLECSSDLLLHHSQTHSPDYGLLCMISPKFLNILLFLTDLGSRLSSLSVISAKTLNNKTFFRVAFLELLAPATER